MILSKIEQKTYIATFVVFPKYHNWFFYTFRVSFSKCILYSMYIESTLALF